MAAQDQATRPLSKGKLLAATAATLAVGAVIVLGFVLPAEFDRDPLGIGRLSGVSRLWAPEENDIGGAAGSIPFARESAVAWRSDVIEIPLSSVSDGMKDSALEYKVHMGEGATLVYSWEVIGDVPAADFTFDFHGHTTPKDAKEEMTVSTHKQGSGLKANGALTAPFDGIQGWLFANGGEKPVIVKVTLAGFYDLVPLGATGNESRVRANVPAAEARPDTPFKAP